MTFSIVRSWAKEIGYTVKKKDDQYYWEITNNNSINGISKSVSKLARDIFNHITDNKFVEHQTNYVREIKHE